MTRRATGNSCNVLWKHQSRKHFTCVYSHNRYTSKTTNNRDQFPHSTRPINFQPLLITYQSRKIKRLEETNIDVYIDVRVRALEYFQVHPILLRYPLRRNENEIKKKKKDKEIESLHVRLLSHRRSNRSILIGGRRDVSSIPRF